MFYSGSSPNTATSAVSFPAASNSWLQAGLHRKQCAFTMCILKLPHIFLPVNMNCIRHRLHLSVLCQAQLSTAAPVRPGLMKVNLFGLYSKYFPVAQPTKH